MTDDRYTRLLARAYLTGWIGADSEMPSHEELDSIAPSDEELEQDWALYNALYNPKDPRPHHIQVIETPERKMRATYNKLFPPPPEPERDEDDDD